MRFPKLAAATQHLQSKPEPDAMKLRHVVESQQFTVPLLMELFDRSRGMERVVARGDCILCTLDAHPVFLRSRNAPLGRPRSVD